ncbi:MAG: pyridoxamine 5-phosphate oxidase [Burkholderiales bacterium PBB5]|nr:MAG: pyridoxamine 5-phosphate oxidase [Burkholderiales bacterium PBB5]
MTHRFADIAFTNSVREHQARMGVVSRNERMQALGGPNDRLGPAEAEFIGSRDNFYMASVSETGWPYVQHRGGPVGFLRVLDETSLGFADFRGNAQYLSAGNLHHDDRVSLILMDYAAKQRLKILGRARLAEEVDNPALVARLENPDYRARVERAFVITVEAFDWNCPQHITPRFTEGELRAVVDPLRVRIHELEALLASRGSGIGGGEHG